MVCFGMTRSVAPGDLLSAALNVTNVASFCLPVSR